MTTTRTNLGPLTTPFTYPASCTLNVIQCSYCLVAWQAQTCSNNPNNAAGVQDNAACWPPRATTGSNSISTGVALNGWGIYSPGLSCPVGYNTACSATGTTVGGFQFQFAISAQETAVGCCPPNYTCKWGGSGDAQTCFSVATSGSFSAVQCSSGTSNAFSYYTVPSTVTVTTTETSTTSASASGAVSASASTITSTAVNIYEFNTVTLYAPMFQLVHQASDVSSSSGSSGSSPAQTSSAGTGLSTGSASSSQLSTGAVAGIAVAAVVVGLSLLGAFVYFFIKQRRAKRQIAYAPPPNLAGNMGMQQPPMGAYSTQDGSYFGSSTTPMSMKSGTMQPSPVYEAPVDSPRHELA
ncbi:hypothetical protein SBRCBS47491_001202 [Sporothrix bragantina]|uniref:Mid2 domain-containing protein n=1 Tax=Sporothrix bragantina TaxID=671064 RepID=A0ABP0AWN4_9PEZI